MSLAFAQLINMVNRMTAISRKADIREFSGAEEAVLPLYKHLKARFYGDFNITEISNDLK
ncbi:MAG: hypothetical protein ACR2PU_00315 [Gammaproteobacteria bacterium]